NGGISLRFAWRAGRAALGVMSLVLSDFEQSRSAHAATDTHGDHHVFHATALAFDQGVAHQTRTGHAVGMADGDAAAVDVVLVRVDAQEVTAVQRLYCECFVQLPQADVVNAQAVLLEQLGNGVDRADTHFLGRVAGDGHATVDTQGLQAARLGQLAIHQDTGGGTVGQLAGVAGGDEAAFDHGLEALQAFQRGLGAVAFVLGERHFTVGNRFGFPIHQHLGGGDGHDLGVETARFLGGGGAHLGAQGIFVLGFAAYLVFPGNQLGRLQHGHVGVFGLGDQVGVNGFADPLVVLVLYTGNVFLATGNHDVHAVYHDLLGGGGNGHQ